MENLIGKWQIVGLKVVQKSGRLVEKDYRKRDLVREFFPNNEMTESAVGHIHAWHDYEYNSDFGILVVEHGNDAAHYCTEFREEDYLILYDRVNGAIIQMEKII